MRSITVLAREISCEVLGGEKKKGRSIPPVSSGGGSRSLLAKKDRKKKMKSKNPKSHPRQTGERKKGRLLLQTEGRKKERKLPISLESNLALVACEMCPKIRGVCTSASGKGGEKGRGKNGEGSCLGLHERGGTDRTHSKVEKREKSEIHHRKLGYHKKEEKKREWGERNLGAARRNLGMPP